MDNNFGMLNTFQQDMTQGMRSMGNEAEPSLAFINMAYDYDLYNPQETKDDLMINDFGISNIDYKVPDLTIKDNQLIKGLERRLNSLMAPLQICLQVSTHDQA